MRKTIAFITTMLLLVALLLSSIGCGDTPYIQREFDSKATGFKLSTYGRTAHVTFSNEQVGSKYKWLSWLDFQQDYKGKCFHVVTHERITEAGPNGYYMITEITEIPCSDTMDESVRIWNSWETE